MVASALDKYPMRKLMLAGQAFRNYPYARYATGVTFQQSNMPAGRMQEKSLYYSKKHHLHGYKVEVSVLPNGQAVNCTQHYPGNTDDIEVFRKNAEFHLQALQKIEGDEEIEDEGRLISQHPISWAVLADKGYQGLACDFRAVTPYKRAPSQTLTLEQVATNGRIAHDRILVDNYFGRLCTLWYICADKYRWDEDKYDVYFQTCVALTNFHIRANPLHREDGDNYARYLQRLREIGESITVNRRETQQRYRENRRNRIATLFVHRERVSRAGARNSHRESPGIGASRRPVGGRARRRLEMTQVTQAASDAESSSDEVALPSKPPVA
ncbi:succinyl-CoA:3-ketoacid coenzyme A transferase [Phytophthora cinnamomi]|uniref:succinyl-CoA:3-ketoacid coenzyme A transferase n=1 Tax=Phytophthora cinnamomi TaxID=4785 RepID=UPI0035596763|nr:succinyl-CoA:3-ketoacid coenzyme A transferase [Phytophthora cinnamomi]